MTDPYIERPWLKTYPDWLPTSLDPVSNTILDDFEESLKTRPEHPCIHYFDRTFTYREMAAYAGPLAAVFRKQGVGQGDRVALVMQNIPQVVIATLAAWMNAAAVVPINPMYTERERNHLLEDSGARTMIIQSDLMAEAGDNTPFPKTLESVLITSVFDLLSGQHPIPSQLKAIKKPEKSAFPDLMSLIENEGVTDFSPLPLKGDTLAYLVYTSGTTGPPKGAMLTHGGITFNTRVFEKTVRLEGSDVVLGIAPMFHITGIVAHLAIAFYLGLPCVLFHRFETEDVLRLVEKYGVTFIVGAITVYTALLNHTDAKTYDLSSINKAYSGGAPVSPGTVDKFQGELGITIHNVYGLTESSSPATITPLGQSGPVDPESGALSVGLVIPDINAWIVDVDNPDRILPFDEAGELVLQGPNMVSGYWQKPEETNAAIRDGRFFTGDVAKIDSAGWVYIVDRKKDLINVSGFKVWPRDVEDVLYQHPDVLEAAVIGIPDDYRGETVKAFVTLRQESAGAVSEDDLIAFCKSRMAAFKYPRIVEIVDDIPKTPTGKFLRRELRQRTT